MVYQVVFRPVLVAGGVPADQITDVDGKQYDSQILGAAPALVSGNNLTILQKLLITTVQANAAQVSASTGLVKYLTLIQAAGNTTSVETALGAL